MSMLSKFYKWVMRKHDVELQEENHRLREQITALNDRHDMHLARIARLSAKYQTLSKRASELEKSYKTLIAKCDAKINSTTK